MRKRSTKNKPAIFRKNQEKSHCPTSEAASPNSDDYFLGKWLQSDLFTLPALILSVFLVGIISLSYLDKNEDVTLQNKVFSLNNNFINNALAEEENDPIEQEKLNKIKYLEKQILKITKGTPMTVMSSEIAQRDQTVAAFLVGIALKESKFGTYSPKKDGRDCFNYWGYRGHENLTTSGYSCFDSPSQAVEIVGNRLEELIQQGRKTPTQMTIWKCGSSCAGHSAESVKSWVNDVSINFYELNKEPEIAKH